MKNKISLTIALILSLLQIFNVYGVTISDSAKQQATAIELDAKSAILIDATTGDILYQKNIDEHQFPASITKLMTVLLALENGNLNDTLTFSHDAVFSIEFGSSHIAVDEGEELTLEQCLYAIMLQSANEVSNGVAEYVAGSMDNFAAMMTQRAQELGCNETNFVNANGLHDENHYTTARDMSLIAKELLKFDIFPELMATLKYDILPTNIQPEIRHLYAQNQLIKESSIFYYDKALGGKTGFTDEAGNTLVSYAKDGETTLISVVLSSSGYGLYTDSVSLFNYGFENFETKIIASKDQSPVSIMVTETQKKQTLNLGLLNLVYPNDIVVTLPKGTDLSTIEPTYNISENYEAPVKEGTVITEVDFMLDGNVVATSDLVAGKTILSSTGTDSPNTADSNKAPISPILVFSLLFIAAGGLIVARLVISKLEYEKRKKRRMQRLKKLRETYGDIPRNG